MHHVKPVTPMYMYVINSAVYIDTNKQTILHGINATKYIYPIITNTSDGYEI